MYCIHLINPARWTLGQVHLLKDVSFNLPQWQPDMEDVCKHELAHTPFSDVKHCSPNQFKSSSSSWPCAHPTPSFHFAPLPRGSAGNTGRAEIGLINIWHWWGGRWWGARSSPVRTNCFTEKQNKKKNPTFAWKILIIAYENKKINEIKVDCKLCFAFRTERDGMKTSLSKRRSALSLSRPNENGEMTQLNICSCRNRRRVEPWRHRRGWARIFITFAGRPKSCWLRKQWCA